MINNLFEPPNRKMSTIFRESRFIYEREVRIERGSEGHFEGLHDWESQLTQYFARTERLKIKTTPPIYKPGWPKEPGYEQSD